MPDVRGVNKLEGVFRSRVLQTDMCHTSLAFTDIDNRRVKKVTKHGSSVARIDGVDAIQNSAAKNRRPRSVRQSSGSVSRVPMGR